ncbi:MAG: polysaccharide pyruvyl transferase family protein [Floccifex sp.]
MKKRIKIDVITLHAVQNYGSVLQALATQEIFKQHGCDVTIIDYIRDDVRYENLVKKWSGGNPIKALIIFPTILRWKKVFQSFTKQYLNLSKNTYTTEDDFASYPLNADAYCTGSDQVWNSKWNNGILPCLYLGFVPADKYKFAFSSSFGQSRLSEDEVNKTRPYLEQYNKISVRESEAKNVLDEQYHIQNSVHIVDPTLCVSGNFWRKYETPRKIKEDYILIYNLNRSKEFDRYAVELSKRTGLKLVRFCTRYDQFYRPGKSILVPEVFDFISLIDNAKYVLTDSFHATAFSLNLHTEPICVYPKEFGGRLESILKQTNQLQRHISDYTDFDVLIRPVDFEFVDNVLDNERINANRFIDTVLSEILNS